MFLNFFRSDTYSYDDNGNISNILNNITGQNIGYVYDSKNQLVRVNNKRDDQTIIYSYDNGGNITEKKIYAYTTADPIVGTPILTKTYSYGATDWKAFMSDLLVNYNGEKDANDNLVQYTYNSILNPLTYRDGTTLTWSMRDLKTVNKTGLSASYNYNADGFRVSKTVNGVTTQFVLDDSGNILKQTSGSNTLLFIYDDNGGRVGLQYNGANYLYVYNAQGDVIAIVDSSHNVVVKYTYDEWGQVLTVTGSMAATLGVQNPFRYRGYCYDEETGWYYLQSRYYDPVTSRYINADGQLNPQEGMTGYNLFQYCGNNPVNRADPTGRAFMFLTAAIGAAVGAVVGGVVGYVKTGTVKGALIGAGVGAVAGGLIGLGAGALAGAVLAGSATASTAAVVAGAGAALSQAGNAISAGLNKISNAISNVANKSSPAVQSTSKVVSEVKNDVINLERVGSALKTDLFHSFPNMVDNYAGYATQTPLNNGATLYQLAGSWTNQIGSYVGRFEWIVQGGQVTHRMFVEGGGLNGIPIMP